MIFHRVLCGGSEGTIRTRERFLSGVSPNVLLQLVLCGRTVRTVLARERFLSRVCANVFYQVIFPKSGIGTVGAGMNLADRCPLH